MVKPQAPGPGRRRARGRPAGESRTRESIAKAAREQFAESGYERATIRSIARQAHVDPKLVSHYFGSKEQLFLAVATPPVPPERPISAIRDGDPADAGRRLAELVVAMLADDEVRERFLSLIRAVAGRPRAAAVLRAFIVQRFLGPFAEGLGVDQPQLRVSLMASQIIGLVMVRHIIRVEPLASLPADRLVDALAPTLQRYLYGPLEEQTDR